eukprot:6106016-Prymnesium_polylepis.1
MGVKRGEGENTGAAGGVRVRWVVSGGGERRTTAARWQRALLREVPHQQPDRRFGARESLDHLGVAAGAAAAREERRRGRANSRGVKLRKMRKAGSVRNEERKAGTA